MADTLGRIQITKHTGKRLERGSMNAPAPKTHLCPLTAMRSVEKQHRDWRNWSAASR